MEIQTNFKATKQWFVILLFWFWPASFSCLGRARKGGAAITVAPSKLFTGKLFTGKLFKTPLDVNRFSSTPSFAYRQVTRYTYRIPRSRANCQ